MLFRSVQSLAPEGIGELALAFEQLKNKLNDEGLFDSKYKKQLPFYPKRIGVVTSRTGAVIKDICHVAKRRNPLVKILLYSVLVQGENASKEIVQGIEFFNKKCPVDVIIIGRGGGSLEDLWAFNEENVIRAIFASKIPIISAVGHETDYTLSDLVSDVRAATPSQAAELAVVEKDALVNYIESLKRDCRYKAYNLFSIKENKFNLLWKHSIFSDKERLLQSRQQELDFLNERLNKVVTDKYVNKFHQMEVIAEKLKVLNPLNVLQRGFSIVKQDDKYIKNIKDIDMDKSLNIELSDGTVETKIVQIKEK